jgi:hypothetical protein
MVDEHKLSPVMKIFAWRGIGAAGATARAPLSAPDIRPIAAETVEPAADEGDDQVGANELSPAMKIFAWRGVTGAAPAAAETRVSISVE